MMVYGEGTYRCSKCGSLQYPELRDPMNLKKGKYDHTCPTCNTMLEPQPTSESKPTRPSSIYAMSKLQQEEIGLLVARTYGIPTTVLRYFNVYGSRQSLSNPYTGVCAVFSSRILNGKPPVLFEDGLMLRDFVHVKDVARANLMALESQRSDYQVLNIGSGVFTSILDLARSLIEIYGSKVEPEISYKYRTNDIRQCYADISKARSAMGYNPTVDLQTGMRELAGWVTSNRLYAVDQFDAAIEDLSRRKLFR
jgi:dTDP-L-rhamnose 4-epimerase